MIHANRTVKVGNQESSIDTPIILYRGDREVEVEFTLNGNKFTFTNDGNVIKSTNATHGQLVINTPTGENMFSEVTECHEGKVVFLITKEMIDELVEVGFYSFQIRLFDDTQMARVTLPPVHQGIDIRNPIAAEDETNVVDICLVDYAIVQKDKYENLVTFLPDGSYNKTDWESRGLITEAKLDKIEDALYTINKNIESSDLSIFNRIEKVNKNVDRRITDVTNEVDAEIEAFERNINDVIEQFKIDTNADMTTHKNEVSEELKSVNSQLEGLHAKDDEMEQRILELNNVVSVEKFGIQPGFDVDVEANTLCFQNMIDYCKNDKIIQFPAGNFVFNQIDLGEGNNITIKGVSSSFASLSQKDIDTGKITDNFTNIIYNGSRGSTFFTHTHCTLILENIRFSNVCKDDSGNFTDDEAKTCILLQHASANNEDKGKCFCFNCGFYGWKVVFGSEFTMKHLEDQWGTQLSESDYSSFKQSCVVASKCRFTKNGVGVNQTVDGRLIDCTFNKNDYAVIFRKSSGFTTISNCRIEWNNYNGIYMQNAHDVTIDKCEFDRNGFAGLYAKENSNCNINGIFRRNGAAVPTVEGEPHRTDYVNNVHICAIGNVDCNFIGSNTVSKTIFDNVGSVDRPTNASNFSDNTNCIIALNNLRGCTKSNKADANLFSNNTDCIFEHNMM